MNVLIIRSASLERFDCLMDGLKSEAAGQSAYHVLTHPHAAAGIRTNYPSVKVLEYPFKGDFNRQRARRLVREGKVPANYEKIIVLAGNISGKGHHNVINTAFLFGQNVHLFNVNGEFIQVTKAAFDREKMIRTVLSPVVISFTVLLSIWGVLKLLAGFLLIYRKRETGHGEAIG